VAQIAFHIQQRQRFAAQTIVEHRCAMTSAILRVVHRRVGIAQQFFRLSIVRAGQRDADRGGSENLFGAEPERRLQFDDDAFGDQHRLAGFGNAFEQHREFIAAQTRDHIACLQAGANAAADLKQQIVTDQMADRIVDDLEAIQIDEQHRELLVRIRGVTLHRLLEPLQQQGAVGQSGQRIVQRLVLQPTLDTFALGDLFAQVAVGQRQRARAFGDATFQPRIRLLQ
jgi:hypothetical protein